MKSDQSLGEYFADVAAANSDRAAIIFPERTFTYDQMAKMIQSFALKFRAAGCGKATGIKLLASDHLVQLTGTIAASVIGAELVVGSGPAKAGGTTLSFIDNPNIPGAADDAIVIDESWSPAIVLPTLGPPIAPQGPLSENTPWLTVQVMRETGPEAVGISEKGMVSRIIAAGSDFTEASRVCSLAPLTSLNFLTRALAVLCRAGAVVVGREPERWAESRVTRVAGSPGEFLALVDRLPAHHRFPTAEITDARPTGPLARRLLQHFDMIEDAYGTAEAGVVHLNRGVRDATGAVRWKSAGAPDNVRIMSRTGAEASAGTVGLVQIRADSRSGAKEGPLWNSTNDLGMWGEAGELVILGRRDDMINVLGRKVPGLAIDQTIGSVDGVQQAACFKNPKPDADDELFAFCVFEEGCNQMQAIASAKYKISKTFGPTFVPRVFRQVSGIPVRQDGLAPDRRACADFVMQIFRQRQLDPDTAE